jgi:tetratricopeptide (TPR) repeat protein
MSRKLIISALMVTLIMMVGCEEEQVLRDDDRFIANPGDVAIVTARGGVPDAREMDLVEQLITARQEYRRSIEDLLKFYRSEGNAASQQWAQNELRAFEQVPHYIYVMPAIALSPDLEAVDDIAEANILYEEAMKLYKDAGAMFIVTDEGKLRAALNKFNQLIMAYQTSNKIDDAAYRAGRIYEHFKDYQIASVYYQRCFQWWDATKYPARFRAAFMLDQRLHMRKEALTIYQMAVERESRYTANTEYAQKRILEMTKPRPEPRSTGRTVRSPVAPDEKLDNIP